MEKNKLKTSSSKTNQQKIWSGIVVSDKTDKTIIVKVERVVPHPLYTKRFTVSRKFAVHDVENKFKVGDIVSFEKTRPISKTKHWQVINTK